MNQVIWILVNCNSLEEAKSIGKAILKQRLSACFDVYSRNLAAYFWPPKSRKIETTTGAMLILETFRDKYNLVTKEVKKNSDGIPISIKLRTNVYDIKELAHACERAGADAISAINTAIGMMIDIDARKPILGNKI